MPARRSLAGAPLAFTILTNPSLDFSCQPLQQSQLADARLRAPAFHARCCPSVVGTLRLFLSGDGKNPSPLFRVACDFDRTDGEASSCSDYSAGQLIASSSQHCRCSSPTCLTLLARLLTFAAQRCRVRSFHRARSCDERLTVRLDPPLAPPRRRHVHGLWRSWSR